MPKTRGPMTCAKPANTGAHASRENATTASTSASVSGRRMTSTPGMTPRTGDVLERPSCRDPTRASARGGGAGGSLLPFDGARRLARHVEHHAVDLFHLVGDPGGYAGQDVVGQPGPVRGNRVLAGHRPQDDGVPVGAPVALDADRARSEEHTSELQSRQY